MRLKRAPAMAGLLALLPAAAFAVSSGNYSPAQQGCSRGADDYNRPGAEAGCHSAVVSVEDGSGHTYASVGTPQTAQGQPAGAPAVTTGQGLGDAGSGLVVYGGADDNLDVGEHDASPQWQNGPSDGGAVLFSVTPSAALSWLAAVMSGNSAFLLTHPTPVGAGAGGCADGLCVSAQSRQTPVFRGGSPGSRDAADYSGATWDPYGCSSGSQASSSPAACGGHTLRWWNQQQGTVYAEPGVQVYEDPDAQASPAFPVYPLPAAYVGTCGVTAGGGAVSAPSSPVTNPAGQVQVSTGC